jgi:hypothetical protein
LVLNLKFELYAHAPQGDLVLNLKFELYAPRKAIVLKKRERERYRERERERE